MVLGRRALLLQPNVLKLLETGTVLAAAQALPHSPLRLVLQII